VNGVEGGGEVRTTLNRARKGDRVEVVEVEGGWEVRQRLKQIGVNEGDILLVKRRAVFGGPIVIETHGSEMAIGRGMAGHVAVRRKA
jgi:Fe2+ transport system protein FeoA